MEDERIIELFWQRSEEAIAQTDVKYGKYCRYIASNILHNKEDSEECVNDTYMKAWDTIPPTRPGILSAFLGRITRNISLDRYRMGHARKRGGGQIAYVIDELGECISTGDTPERIVEHQELVEILNKFLGNLNEEKRRIFMRRYWYMSSVKEIARDYKLTNSKVKMVLMRTRNELKEVLEREGLI